MAINSAIAIRGFRGAMETVLKVCLFSRERQLVQGLVHTKTLFVIRMSESV